MLTTRTVAGAATAVVVVPSSSSPEQPAAATAATASSAHPRRTPGVSRRRGSYTRPTPGLYLELASGLAPDDYAASRVDEVLALPAVERATWWTNLCRDRTDLPRVLDELDSLGVYEVGDGFDAPATPDGVAGHHFRRTPRPGQGRLSVNPTVGLSLVLISPKTPDRAQELRDWADFVHIAEITAAGVPGYTMITPYENARGGDAGPDEPRYLHFYEMDTADAEGAFQRMTPLVAERLGGSDSARFREWAWHEALRILYVNSFRMVGSRH